MRFEIFRFGRVFFQNLSKIGMSEVAYNAAFNLYEFFNFFLNLCQSLSHSSNPLRFFQIFDLFLNEKVTGKN